MEKILLFLLCFVTLSVHAQDIIVKKDGSIIQSKVLEVNETSIKYKRQTNQNGPTYTISISDVLSVNYANGEKESFINVNSDASTSEASMSPQYIQKPTDTRNAELISMYNKYYAPTQKLKKAHKKTEYYMLIFGVASSSVLSNEDIEMTFVRHFSNPSPDYHHVVYELCIKNKTDKTIYIDKGNCFRLLSEGSFFCYYAPTEQVTVNQGKGGGTSLGLGAVAGALGIGGAVGQLASGIGVSGGSFNSVATTYTPQRFLIIPPNAKQNLTKEKAVYVKGSASIWSTAEYKLLEQEESFNFKELHASRIYYESFSLEMGEPNPSELRLPKGLVKMGEVLEYNETNSPYSRDYIITYSTEENFRTYSSLKAKVYLREIIGADKLRTGHKPQSEKYIEGITPYTIEGYCVAEDL